MPEDGLLQLSARADRIQITYTNKKNQALNINWPPYPGKVKCSLQECLFSSSSHRHSVASTLPRETWEEEETLMPIGVI